MIGKEELLMEPYKILRDYYSELYLQYGQDERSLGWTKNKQNIRFHELIKHILMKNRTAQVSLLDIGCGFGDLYTYIRANKLPISYYGIDIMPDFIEIAQKNHEDIRDNFLLAEFLEWKENEMTKRLPMKWDWIVESGFFGHKLFETEEEMYDYIYRVMKKGMELCEVGICFDFLSDKVDYRTSQNDFHASPEKILEMAYGFSRNVVLDNSTMPFEFNITIWKNDSFAKGKTIFNDYMEQDKM